MLFHRFCHRQDYSPGKTCERESGVSSLFPSYIEPKMPCFEISPKFYNWLRRFAAVFYKRHFLTVVRAPTDIAFDSPVQRRRNAINNGKIRSFYRMFGKLFAQTAVRFIIFGNDQQAASVFVNTVDNARTFYAADAGKAVPTMVKQGINQSSAMRSGAPDVQSFLPVC